MEKTKREARENEREYCKNNIEYYIDTYGHIEDKDAEDLIQPFRMWKEQREALRSIMTHKLNIALKARQLGMSWIACHLVSHLISTSSGKTAIGLSKSEEEAKELVRRVSVILRYNPELVAEKGFEPPNWDGPVFNATALTITVVYPDNTESVFKGLASSPGAGRSFTANLIIFDEWAFQQFAEEIWKGGFPTINRPNGGKVFGLSTIARGSFFESLFTDPDNGFNKIFIPWYADPSRDEEWYRKTKLALGDLITEEYPATIEEALMVPGGSYFPEVRKDTHETDKMPSGNVRRYCSLDYGLDKLAAYFIAIDVEGHEVAYREVWESNLTISQAANLLLHVSSEEHIDMWLAPPDLWNRRQETGKSVASIFLEYGINLTKINNDLFNGCMALKEHLKLDEETHLPMLQFLTGTCPKAIWSLQKIQKDKIKPSVYAKQPHEYTHSVDALRGFAVWWTLPGKKDKPQKKKWRKDLIEDYRRANKEIRALMIKQLGEPML